MLFSRVETVMYVEGFVWKLDAVERLSETVRQILQTRRDFPLTPEDRALRYQHLWSQAGQQFAAFDARQPHMAARPPKAGRGSDRI